MLKISAQIRIQTASAEQVIRTSLDDSEIEIPWETRINPKQEQWP